MGETAEEAPLRHLGSAEPRLGRRALQCEPGSGQEAPDAREVGVDGRRAHMERIGGLEDVDPLGFVEERANERVEAVARSSGIRSDRAESGRSIRTRPIAVRPGLDGGGRGHSRVERGDIRPDAARSHPEGIGESRRRRPLALAHQERQEPVLSRSRHGLSLGVVEPALLADSVPVNHARAALEQLPTSHPPQFPPLRKEEWLSAPSDFTRMANKEADR